MGCHFLLQGIFPTRDWTQVLLKLSPEPGQAGAPGTWWMIILGGGFLKEFCFEGQVRADTEWEAPGAENAEILQGQCSTFPKAWGRLLSWMPRGRGRMGIPYTLSHTQSMAEAQICQSERGPPLRAPKHRGLGDPGWPTGVCSHSQSLPQTLEDGSGLGSLGVPFTGAAFPGGPPNTLSHLNYWVILSDLWSYFAHTHQALWFLCLLVSSWKFPQLWGLI